MAESQLASLAASNQQQHLPPSCRPLSPSFTQPTSSSLLHTLSPFPFNSYFLYAHYQHYYYKIKVSFSSTSQLRSFPSLRRLFRRSLQTLSGVLEESFSPLPPTKNLFYPLYSHFFKSILTCMYSRPLRPPRFQNSRLFELLFSTLQ